MIRSRRNSLTFATAIFSATILTVSIAAAQQPLGDPKMATANRAAAKEQPVKVDDHGLDALRYVVAQRDLGVRPGIRWLG